MPKKRLRVCMISDFFYPNMGGVEEHIYNLSQCLILNGHKVVVITHNYDKRIGIRYMTNGLKVYYLPICVFYNQCILPTMICNIPLLRYIFIREQIQIVHAHSAFSALAHEGMLIGTLMGLKTVFTDHSLFGFADTSAVITNKMLEISLKSCDHIVCVSHISKENTVLRASANFSEVSVIPNAVDSYHFTPDISKRPTDCVVIVIISRLVYRKGVDLMAQIIVDLCQRNENVRFLIGGDGPKRGLIEEIRERNFLQDRVTLLGSLKHSEVRDVLNCGHIFLNTSLTEAYCMAIVEAVSCGLQVVTTRVGGIPEVLPSDLVYLREPNVNSLVQGLEEAIVDLQTANTVCPYKRNEMIRNYYNWPNVTSRTELIYETILRNERIPFGKLLRKYLSTGVWPFLLVVSLCHIILEVLEYLVPRRRIDIAKNYKVQEFRK